jgi:hypothetical protein
LDLGETAPRLRPPPPIHSLMSPPTLRHLSPWMTSPNRWEPGDFAIPRLSSSSVLTLPMAATTAVCYATDEGDDMTKLGPHSNSAHPGPASRLGCGPCVRCSPPCQRRLRSNPSRARATSRNTFTHFLSLARLTHLPNAARQDWSTWAGSSGPGCQICPPLMLSLYCL